jgi:hypothetical protein
MSHFVEERATCRKAARNSDEAAGGQLVRHHALQHQMVRAPLHNARLECNL